VHHAGTVRQALDTLNPYSWQPEQQCRTVGHKPSPFLRPIASQLSDFGRPRASSCNDTPYESEITTARLKLKGHYAIAFQGMYEGVVVFVRVSYHR